MKKEKKTTFYETQCRVFQAVNGKDLAILTCTVFD